MTLTAGEKIRIQRERIKISQAEAAKKAGITPQTLCKIETGKYSDLNKKTMDGLATALDTTVQYLFYEEV